MQKVCKVVGFSLAIAFLAVALIGCTGDESSNESSKDVQTVGKNEKLKVGEVQWQVMNVKKQKVIPGQFGDSTKADGTFIIVKLKAINKGNESGTIDSNQLKIVDQKDRSFESSSKGSTAIMMQDKEEIFLKDVQPDTATQGYAVFDIAKDSKNLKLRIEDLRFTSSEYGFIKLGI